MLGTGTVSDPFKISTPQDLSDMRINTAQGIYYELTQDIDMVSFGNFDPIGVASGFRGNFDGKGHVIKNLTINYENIYPSLFAQYFYGTCQNVGVENPQINKNSSLGQRFAGALSGNSYGATFRNCYTTGGYIKAQDESGGLFGKLNASTVEDCYSNNEIVINGEYYGGGFAGSTDTGTTVRRSYSTGKVTYTSASSPWNGKGGFVGFVRDGTVVFENCFYDKQTSTQSLSTSWGTTPDTPVVGILGKTTAEMKTQSTYTGYDFTNTWLIQSDYPKLLIFGMPAAPPVLMTINVMSTMNPIGSIVSRKARTIKELTSYVNAILSDSKRNTKVFNNVEGYLSPFNSNATQSHRTVVSSRHDVVSYMSPIYSSAYRESKTVKHLLATVNPLGGSVDVFISMNTKGANAYVSVIQNPSRVSEIRSESITSYIQNPSSVEVI